MKFGHVDRPARLLLRLRNSNQGEGCSVGEEGTGHSLGPLVVLLKVAIGARK